jgi:hypothetical protein
MRELRILKIPALNVEKCILNIPRLEDLVRCFYLVMSAWNPDHEFKEFVKRTLKTSGYDPLDFGYVK